jgi:histone acetyltransferase (RNA polymerase elongator complex component)
MIIPFFIPHSGCPHQCVFCNQKNITGNQSPVDPAAIPQKISEYFQTNKSNEPAEVAFYGGTFTALLPDLQRAYLSQVQPFVQSGRIKHIRVSTRPDYVDREILAVLKKHRVLVVELGVQSMCDDVLARAGRGHTSADTVRAATLLRELGFKTGFQIMPGLPGDSSDTIRSTVEKVIELRPEFVRIYPALVIKETPLEKLYRKGLYEPLTLDQAIAVCKDAFMKFEQAGINIIRMGLQPTEELEKPGTILAGPYHPAFRQLVESSILLNAMRFQLNTRNARTGSAVFHIHPRDMSAAVGQHHANIEQLKKEFRLADVTLIEDQGVRRSRIILQGG